MSEYLRLVSQHLLQDGPTRPDSAIEVRFARIAGELSRRWQGGDIDDYLGSLLIDTRGGRQGFPADVLDELMFLSGLRWHMEHMDIVPQDDTRPDAFSFCATNESELRRCGTSGSWVLV
ncbi:MAG: hypothetical protein AB1831_02510 [Pseudomonadota bacterium]